MPARLDVGSADLADDPADNGQQLHHGEAMTWRFDGAVAHSRREGAHVRPLAAENRLAARLADLERHEADLVRRLIILKERYAFTPSEVTWERVEELSIGLTGIRHEIDRLRV